VDSLTDPRTYLERIGYHGPATPTVDTLRALHRAHLFTVPFENLDIVRGRKILCEEDAFLRKIVEQRRGGFCYELNGAFAALLRQLGFHVTLLSARVARPNGSDGPAFDHLALRVDVEKPWLVDVGFGDSFLEPLPLRSENEHREGPRKFRIVGRKEYLCVERAEEDELWQPQYSFTLEPKTLSDFSGMCHYHQTSPESTFTQKTVCTKATPEGRITLTADRLLVRANGKQESRPVATEEWSGMLQKYFGIKLEIRVPRNG
jgi:N-hydroxyarylamine O-acetyltransferase